MKMELHFMNARLHDHKHRLNLMELFKMVQYLYMFILVVFSKCIEFKKMDLRFGYNDSCRACWMNGEWGLMGIKFHPFIRMGMNGDE